MKAIRLVRFGAPHVLELHELAVPTPSSGEVLVRARFAGVNFADVTLRRAAHPWPDPPPLTPGFEASGVVAAVGEGVTETRPGERVATLHFGLGAYAEYQLVPASQVIPLPADVSFESATALMLQGLTAHVLTFENPRFAPGQTALIHAAAGGMGRLLTQWLKRRGATVIGTVSTPEKARLAAAAGADHVIDYRARDFAEETLRFTQGRGADYIIDGVGSATFESNLEAVAPRGHIAFYGFASGAPDALDLRRLMAKSVSVSGENVACYVRTREELSRRASAVFDAHREGTLLPRIERVLPLARAAEAHELLESRATAGKVLLEI
ncbi:quinone oxidoreductase family protein [Sorangium sp. So ce128]|uniref:quinone oxidoreductase family protein n=1 Tax=Sorangium sp. So ce128 TaxID=3133281 RepID=UPI003F5EB1DD